MCGLFLLALLALSDPVPDPMDAFLINRGTLSLEVDYAYRKGAVATAAPFRESDVLNGRPELPFRVATTVNGRWAHDGKTEYVESYSPINIDQFRKKDQARPDTRRKFQVIFNDDIYAVLHEGTPNVSTDLVDRMAVLGGTAGPFHWIGIQPFPDILRREVKDAIPIVSTGRIGQAEVQIVLYEKVGDASSIYQVQVFHDLAAGGVPRFMRLFYKNKATGKGLLKSMLVKDLHVGKRGGVCPTSWTSMHVSKIGKLDTLRGVGFDGIELPPQSVRVATFDARVTKDAVAEVNLDHCEDVQRIDALGGMVKNTPRKPKLSMNDLKSRARHLLTATSAPAAATLDVAELAEPEPPSSKFYVILSTTIVLALFAALLARKRVKNLFAAGAVLAFSMTGCGPRPADGAHLSLALTQQVFVLGGGQRSFQATLELKNEGTKPLLISKIDAGCSCRRIESGVLPLALEPGRSAKVGMELDNKDLIDGERRFLLTLDTYFGPWQQHVRCQVFSESAASPSEIVNANLRADESFVFDVQFKRMYKRSDSDRPGYDLRKPNKFVAKLVDRRVAPHDKLPGYMLEVVQYQFETASAREPVGDYFYCIPYVRS